MVDQRPPTFDARGIGRIGTAGSARRETAPIAVAWAAAEGWNPGVDDAERFAAADPDAFLSETRDGETVATVSCARYGDAYAFIGFFIVDPALRGIGVGGALFERALSHAGGRAVGLDGVLAQQAYYERRGFEFAHRNVRWRGVGGGTQPGTCVDLTRIPFGELLAYDMRVFGAERKRFLQLWIDRPAGHALAAVDERGKLTGYGVLRPCEVGVKIGPLFADDAGVADTLLRGLLAMAGPGTEVFVDMPAANSATRRLREGRQLDPVFETVRMYRGGRPPEDITRVYGVTTFEFG